MLQTLLKTLLVLVVVGLVFTVWNILAMPALRDAPLGIYAARLLLALVLSLAIGAERELRHKPAGMRTVTMVGVGACLFTLAGVSAFASAGDTNSMSRLIQGILTGIGFLGAGTIIREHAHVEGLTTAATIWSVAGIGLTFALGEYALAIMGTVAILLVLVVLPVIEKALGGGEQFTDKKRD